MMPGGSRSAAGPVADKHLAGLIRPVVAAAGMDLESLRVSVAGRRRVLRVIVDSDEGVSLDDAALVSRDISAALDATDAMGNAPYTLEVSSPGVDRPLTEPRHWRRAIGRLVKTQIESQPLAGRVRAVEDAGVIFDVDGVTQQVPWSHLGRGRVQVEFNRPSDARAASDGIDGEDM
jgi:ribosome maturation factor RimP